MRSRTVRTPLALLAALGLLVAITAIPATADSHDACASEGQSTGQVADGVTITYDSLFVCTDAAASGTWSITVDVANDDASTASVQIDEAVLSHTSPQPLGESPDASAATDDLPLSVEPGTTVSVGIGGDYELISTDDGDEKAILHLRLSGTAGEDVFLIGVNVQILGPGVDAELDDIETIDDPNGDAEGRPEWAPGPPPWVLAILEALFANGFPWGSEDFPPAGDDGEEGTTEADRADHPGGRPSWAGPPSGLPGRAGGDDGDGDDEDAGPPDFVRPGGPTHTIPGQNRP